MMKFDKIRGILALCHPERSEGSGGRANRKPPPEILRCAQDDRPASPLFINQNPIFKVCHFLASVWNFIQIYIDKSQIICYLFNMVKYFKGKEGASNAYK